ncbi:MAG: phosphoribosylanthranilate isomerase [Alphaproteobacteria bacterium]|nr:phosphoribosylanthranilate isomerase [Alphaproteobacteria bacterium]
MRVKICGLRTLDDVKAAVDAGATAVGFVFTESVRRVTPAEARALIEAVPHGVEAIAVFDDIGDTELIAKVLDLGIDGVQAPEPPPGLARAGAFFLRSVPDGDDLEARLGEPNVGTILSGSLRGCVLVDSAFGGGSGRVADWERVELASAGHPVVLAGGLTPENVAEAIRTVRPIGVDVSSGVERAPGQKDPERIRAFVKAAKEAG